MFSVPLKKVWIYSIILISAGRAYAQDAAAEPEEKNQTALTDAEPAPPTPVAENTLEACKDGIDNDADGHVDCDDQDCEIFALCAAPSAPPPEEEKMKLLPPPSKPVERIFIPETGRRCFDGIDNNDNGEIDCHEASCRNSRRCKAVMYERPEPEGKAPGLFISIGTGVALPNFRTPTIETKWTNDDGDTFDVPFDPDMGFMLDLQVGYLFLKFLGAGISFKSAFTFASNRQLYFDTTDDPSNYKYTAHKYYGNLSAFVRFQWPFRFVTPYLNVHAGYSAVQATWDIYDPRNSWNDIDNADFYDDFFYFFGERTEIRSDRNRHFTFALEPGLDASIIRRLFSAGIRVWIPVISVKDSSMDNIGVLATFTFTPTWREPLQLKPEFAEQQP
jgi:hypothetical protein